MKLIKMRVSVTYCQNTVLSESWLWQYKTQPPPTCGVTGLCWPFLMAPPILNSLLVRICDRFDFGMIKHNPPSPTHGVTMVCWPFLMAPHILILLLVWGIWQSHMRVSLTDCKNTVRDLIWHDQTQKKGCCIHTSMCMISVWDHMIFLYYTWLYGGHWNKHSLQTVLIFCYYFKFPDFWI